MANKTISKAKAEKPSKSVLEKGSTDVHAQEVEAGNVSAKTDPAIPENPVSQSQPTDNAEVRKEIKIITDLVIALGMKRKEINLAKKKLSTLEEELKALEAKVQINSYANDLLSAINQSFEDDTISPNSVEQKPKSRGNYLPAMIEWFKSQPNQTASQKLAYATLKDLGNQNRTAFFDSKTEYFSKDSSKKTITLITDKLS